MALERPLHSLETMNGRAKILVVDDDPEMRTLLRDFLTSRGYEVATASSGAEALTHVGMGASRTAPDLVVSDVRMAPMNGMELLKKLTAERPSLPVVLVSAFGDREMERQATSSGARRFFAKPFPLGEFDSAIRKELERRKP